MVDLGGRSLAFDRGPRRSADRDRQPETLGGSFSAVSQPNFAGKYAFETGTLKLSENEHREEMNTNVSNNYFNGVSKKKYPYKSGIRKFK